MNFLRKLHLLAGLLLVASPIVAETDTDDVLLSAVQDELKRSMEELQLEESGPPYFISYAVRDIDVITVSANPRSVAQGNKTRYRDVIVAVRVGDYSVDNTNWMSAQRFGSFTRTARLPITDDYWQIRRSIWRATDQAYKDALKSLSAKRAAFENRTQLREVPDFSQEEATNYTKLEQYPPISLAYMKQLATKLSSAFPSSAELFQSAVEVSSNTVHRTFVNSEGTLVRNSSRGCFARITATSQADDGREIMDFEFGVSNDCLDFPVAEVQERVGALAQRITEQRNSTTVATYNGPVLFEGQAAAELLGQGFMPRLIATRIPSSDNANMEAQFQALRNPFLDKIGARVLPRSLTVVDDPTLEDHEGVPLAGNYVVDAEGVTARRTSLVERGVLKTLLTSRTPVDDLRSSTGSNRGFGAMPSNLIFTPRGGATSEELREELSALAEEYGLEYGIVIRRLVNLAGMSVGSSGRPIFSFNPMSMLSGNLGILPTLQAYKVFPDGREEPISLMTISNFSDRMFREIVAVSDEVARHDVVYLPTSNMAFGGFGSIASMSSPPIVSMIVPSLLFEEITLKQTDETYPQLPVVPHPLAESVE